jgi:hypothetical protein
MLLCNGPPSCAERAGEGRSVQEPLNGSEMIIEIAVARHETGLAVDAERFIPAGRGADDGAACGHRFDGRQEETFALVR